MGIELTGADHFYNSPGVTETTTPIEKWGYDHYSALASAEESATLRLPIQNRNMRCNARSNPGFATYVHLREGWGSYTFRQPTRLNDGTVLSGHDEWDCLRDLADYGLLRLEWKELMSETSGYDYYRATVELTDLGAALAARVRRAAQCNLNFDAFRLTPDDLAELAGVAPTLYRGLR